MVEELLQSFRKMCGRVDEYYFYFREMSALAVRYPAVKLRQKEFQKTGGAYFYQSFQNMFKPESIREGIILSEVLTRPMDRRKIRKCR